MSDIRIEYGYDARPAAAKVMLYAAQHVLAAFNGIVAVPLIVGGALAMGTEEIAFYVGCTLFAAGIATVIQSCGVAGIGARMPCVMGTDFTFVAPSIAVGRQLGMAGIFTATVLGSLSEMVYSRLLPRLKRLFPPLVTSIVITLIGLTLIPVGIDWACGGYGSPDYGAPANLGMSLAVMFFIIYLNRKGSAFIRSGAVFFGIIFGYLLSLLSGSLDLGAVARARWFMIPSPLKFGWSFSFTALLPFLVAYIVTTVETIGDLKAIGEVSGKEADDQQIRRGIMGDGIGSLLGGLLNAGPNTSFSQNVGIIPITGVASRHVVTFSGIILICMGLFPKLGAFVAVMPEPVLGGAGLMMFGMIAAAGISGLTKARLDTRGLVIIAVSLALGIGVTVRPAMLDHAGDTLKILFSSGITTGTISAVTLNLLLRPSTDD